MWNILECYPSPFRLGFWRASTDQCHSHLFPRGEMSQEECFERRKQSGWSLKTLQSFQMLSSMATALLYRKSGLPSRGPSCTVLWFSQKVSAGLLLYSLICALTWTFITLATRCLLMTFKLTRITVPATGVWSSVRTAATRLPVWKSTVELRRVVVWKAADLLRRTVLTCASP